MLGYVVGAFSILPGDLTTSIVDAPSINLPRKRCPVHRRRAAVAVNPCPQRAQWSKQVILDPNRKPTGLVHRYMTNLNLPWSQCRQLHYYNHIDCIVFRWANTPQFEAELEGDP